MFSRLTVITAARAEGAHTCCTKPSKPKRGCRQSWQTCQQKIPNALKILLLSYSWLPAVQQLQRRGGGTGKLYNLTAYSFGTNNFGEKCRKEENTLNIYCPPPILKGTKRTAGKCHDHLQTSSSCTS